MSVNNEVGIAIYYIYINLIFILYLVTIKKNTLKFTFTLLNAMAKPRGFFITGHKQINGSFTIQYPS